MNTNSGNSEKNIEYYHTQFEEMFQLVKNNKSNEIDKDKLKELVDDYKTNFQNNLKYNNCWPSLWQCLRLI